MQRTDPESGLVKRFRLLNDLRINVFLSLLTNFLARENPNSKSKGPKDLMSAFFVVSFFFLQQPKMTNLRVFMHLMAEYE